MSEKQGCPDRDRAVRRRAEPAHDPREPGSHALDRPVAPERNHDPGSGRPARAPRPRSTPAPRGGRHDPAAAQPASGSRKQSRLPTPATKPTRLRPDEVRPGTRIETRQLKDLIPSPWQATYYDDLSEHDRKSLAASIRKNGLRQPIEILPANAAGLPANTILDGCQRCACLRLHGEIEAPVLVRYDLAEVDRPAIEREFLAPNKERRQLDSLSKARIAKRLWELGRGRKTGKVSAFEAGDLRDHVGKEIGMSGRNLNRYLNVLQTPVEVQNALRSRAIKLVVAEQVAFLDSTAQERIARRIRDGETAASVIAEMVAPAERRGAPRSALNRLVREIQRAHASLSHHVDQVAVEADARDALREGRALLDRLMTRAKQQETIRAKSRAQLAKRLKSIGA